ncbi:MAG: hypothetical protein MZV49_24350 [Rhodopseudomonas palustris]|nr:hypothetical protein [Rhodopseudomonas palustris]
MRGSKVVLDKQTRMGAATNAAAAANLGWIRWRRKGPSRERSHSKEIPEAPGRTFEELYDMVLADKRYEADAENLFDYAQNTIDKTLRYGKEGWAPNSSRT